MRAAAFDVVETTPDPPHGSNYLDFGGGGVDETFGVGAGGVGVGMGASRAVFPVQIWVVGGIEVIGSLPGGHVSSVIEREGVGDASSSGGYASTMLEAADFLPSKCIISCYMLSAFHTSKLPIWILLTSTVR